MRIDRLLIANRGEIACRIARTAHALGIATVAVYSDADAGARHLRDAGMAVRIGPAPASESYLNAEAIVDAALRSGAQAVHPGYGFLSENADFAQACVDAGLVFIGPSADAIRAMGDKASAKVRMLDAGVPCVPGWHGDDTDPAAMAAHAEQVGYPLLVKAALGGGGRGMRTVPSADELGAAIDSARREALAAFGDGTLLLERLIERGAHVEIQVFADTHGNTLHLFERDCSAQRRRQKVIEESPSPLVDETLREAMGAAAVAAARAIDYVGAGTVEFMLAPDGEFYFLEMNTRLQVEHPVTEMTCGVDLVEWQIRVARGEPLPLTQASIPRRGHAVEARLYAEDPARQFAPQSGRLLLARQREAPGLRYDFGVQRGDVVTPFYDPMLGKIIAHGRDRDEACERLRAALTGSAWLGVITNRRFLLELLDSEAFRAGRMHTALIDDWAANGDGPFAEPGLPLAAWQLAALLIVERSGGRWFYTSGHVEFDVTLTLEDELRTFRIRRDRHAVVSVEHADEVCRMRLVDRDGEHIVFERDGIGDRATALWDGDRLHLAWRGVTGTFGEPRSGATVREAGDERQVTAPVAGVVREVLVEAGQSVAAGERLIVMEAMKVEMLLTAGTDGRVASIGAAAGDQVAAGALLVELERKD